MNVNATMRVGVWRPSAVARTRERALSALDEAAARAAQAGAGWLLAPELFFPGALRGEAAELSDGPFAHGAAEIARSRRTGIAVGYLERAFGHLFSAVLLLDACGLARAHYRRTHLTAAEADVLAPGQWLTLAPLGPQRAGVLAGADLLRPEPAAALVVAGAGVVLVAGCFRGVPTDLVVALARARAVENGVPVLIADHVRPGDESGWAGAVEADGRVHDGARADSLVIVDLPSAPPRELPARRPELYRRLCAIDE